MFKKYILLSLMLSSASALTAGFESTVFTQDTSDPQHPHRLNYNLSGSDKEGNSWEAHEVTLDKEDVRFHKGLFNNPEVMTFFANGQLRAPRTTKRRIKKFWTPRSSEGQPHSAMTVYYQHPSISSKARIGNVVAGGGDEEGVSEVAYAFLPKLGDDGLSLGGRGIASSVVREVVETWAPEVRRIGEGRGLQESDAPIQKAFLSAFGGKVLSRMDATASPENIGSWKVLTRNGFKPAESRVDKGQEAIVSLREMGVKHESTKEEIIKLFDINDQFVKGKRYPIIDPDGENKVFSYKIEEVEIRGEKVEIPVVKYHFEYYLGH